MVGHEDGAFIQLDGYMQGSTFKEVMGERGESLAPPQPSRPLCVGVGVKRMALGNSLREPSACSR